MIETLQMTRQEERGIHAATRRAITAPTTMPAMAPPEMADEPLCPLGVMGTTAGPGLSRLGAAFGPKGLVSKGLLMEVSFKCGSTFGKPAPIFRAIISRQGVFQAAKLDGSCGTHRFGKSKDAPSVSHS